MSMEVSRRNLLKMGGMAAAGAFAAGTLAGCAAPQTTEASSSANVTKSDTPDFLKQPEPITEFVETLEYDVVVVGAGESGCAAAHTALEGGCSVAVVQNIATAQSSGNLGTGVNLDKTDEAGIQACVDLMLEKNSYRSDRSLIEAWARNSQEAISWWADTTLSRGVEAMPFDSVREHNDYEFCLMGAQYTVEGSYNTATLAVAEQLAEDGVEFFFNTPMVQLYKEGDRVTGAICETEEGYKLFKGSKAIILASGDYSGNQEMRDYYCPDLRGFKTMSENRTGMGMMAGIWVGAQMTPLNHSKMVHGGGQLTRFQIPFLNIDIHGKRFMNEVLCFGFLNNFARKYLAEYDYNNPNAACFFTIIPSNWAEMANQWIAEDPTEVAFGGGGAPDDAQFIKGETFEELAANINAYMEENAWGIDPIDEATIVESIEHYNEVCASGVDTDFGKRAKYMTPIEKGPFFAVPRGATSVPAILGGLTVNAEQQCLDADANPIPGLYAAGNASGQFYGGVDYPMDIEGISVGRAITSGYIAGRSAASE